MAITRNKRLERRRYIRLEAPIKMTCIAPDNGRIYNAVSRDLSADGLRFEVHDKTLREGGIVELKLDIPGTPNPVHAKGRVIWKKKLSLEDAAPFDVGIEFTEVEEDNKNTFLKYLCDLMYNLSKETKYAAEYI